MENKTLEQQVADTILQRRTTSLEIGGHVYDIPAPTPATIMMVSEEAAKMPQISKNPKSIFNETLRTARHCGAVGRIAAILVLGAKRIRENRRVVVAERRRWSWRKLRLTTERETVGELDFVAGRIMEDITPATLNEAVTRRLMEMQLGDFFGLTTSLSEINTLAATREVEPTAHGQQ